MKDKTLYIVSGYMRTGTSMIMKALEEGGMIAEYNQSREKMRLHYADEKYDPNFGGLYELDVREYRNDDFPRKYKGKLIKALGRTIPIMRVMPNGIRVVFMRRDIEEIRQSYLAFFGSNLRNIEGLDKRMEDTIEIIKNRKDVLNIDVFWYREVLQNPQKHFEILKSHNWNINIEKAVRVIDPKYCRYKREELIEGVV